MGYIRLSGRLGNSFFQLAFALDYWGSPDRFMAVRNAGMQYGHPVHYYLFNRQVFTRVGHAPCIPTRIPADRIYFCEPWTHDRCPEYVLIEPGRYDAVVNAPLIHKFHVEHCDMRLLVRDKWLNAPRHGHPVLHIRGTDMDAVPAFKEYRPGREWYLRALGTMGACPGDCLVCTDDPGKAAWLFPELVPQIKARSTGEDLLLMAGAAGIVSSNSTMAWFASWLGGGVPLFMRRQWSLWMTDVEPYLGGGCRVIVD